MKLWWNDEGRLGNISYFKARTLLAALDLEMLSPRDYWRALQDACILGDKAMVKELLSNKYAEWLDIIYFKEAGKCYALEHPSIKADGSWDSIADKDRIKEVNPPKGRHGWFTIDNLDDIFAAIDSDTGFPRAGIVNDEVEKKGEVFKYWDIYTDMDCHMSAIRGYVPSSDTPSFDCGMPSAVDDAPFLMIRPCRRELLSPLIDSNALERLNCLAREYDSAMAAREHEIFYDKKEYLLSLLSNDLPREFKEILRKAPENSLFKMREKIVDMLGFLRIYAIHKGDSRAQEEINTVIQDIFSSLRISYQDFANFIISSRD